MSSIVYSTSTLKLGLCYTFINVYCLASYYLLWTCRHKFESITKRVPAYIGICAFANTFLLNVFFFSEFQFYFNVPCFVLLGLYYLLFPLWMYSLVIRNIHVIFLHYLNQARFDLNHSKSSNNKNTNSKVKYSLFQDMTMVDRMVFNLARWLQMRLWKLRSAFVRRPRSTSVSTDALAKTSTIGGSTSMDQLGKSELSSTAGANRKAIKSEKTLAKLNAFSSQDLILIYFFLFIFCFVVLIIAYILYPGFSPIAFAFPPCPNSSGYNIMYLQCALYFVITPFFLFAMRRIDDTFGFRLESVLSYVTFLITFVCFYLNVPSPIPGTDNFYRIFGGMCQFFCMVNLPVIIGFLDRRKLKALNYDKDSFNRVLTDPKLYNLLKTIMANTFCMENIVFYEEYKATFQGSKGENLERGYLNTKLKYFLTNFVETNSPYELNISDPLRRAYKAEVSNTEAALQKLSQINEEVLKLIYTNSFPRFLQAHEAMLKKNIDGSDS